MAQVHDVAAALIERQHAQGRTIDKMQLQKLLYLVQGASIARTAKPAFRAAIRAYKHGPVVREVESTYRDVCANADPIPRVLGGNPAKLEPELSAVVDEVLDVFGTWTAPNLEKHTKDSGSPWRRARGSTPDGQPSSTEIALKDIVSWFVTHPIDPNAGEETRPRYEPGSPDPDGDIRHGRLTRHDSLESIFADG